MRGVGDLGVELDGVEASRRRGHGRHRTARRRGEALKSRRRLQDGVAVAHPRRHRLRRSLGDDPFQERVPDLDPHVGAPVFPVLGRNHPAAEDPRHRLHAVADAEDGHPGLEQGDRRKRRALVVDARRSTGQDDGLVGP